LTASPLALRARAAITAPQARAGRLIKQHGTRGAMLKLIATPVFLSLAMVNYNEAIYLCVIPGPFSFLSSMWFMYLVMAVIHIDAWLELLRARLAKSPKGAK
jgi:hypothetical protein